MARADAVSLDEVRRVAALARLDLTDEQARAFAADLNGILEHMALLQEVETSGVAEYSSPGEAMRLRDDRGPPIPLADPPAAFAPQMRDGFFIVPRLATHGGEDAEA
ncbi:MAG: Asp-tRNA(Asn)/Glu-tRNA(Gln) amidotransferase subunit GatC [Gemmatimonadaceae bacterium]